MAASLAAPAGSGGSEEQQVAGTPIEQDSGPSCQGVSLSSTTTYGHPASTAFKLDTEIRAFVRQLVQEFLEQDALAQLGPAEAEHARAWLARGRRAAGRRQRRPTESVSGAK